MITVLENPKVILALGVSTSIIILSMKVNSSDASTVLVNLSNMVKECAVTIRVGNTY